jgi:hypothetical protein
MSTEKFKGYAGSSLALYQIIQVRHLHIQGRDNFKLHKHLLLNINSLQCDFRSKRSLGKTTAFSLGCQSE